MKIPDKEHISKLKFHDILEKSLNNSVEAFFKVLVVLLLINLKIVIRM